MAGYQGQFDSYAADANSAVANNTTALQEAFFGMHPAHVRRLLSSISRLLGKIDLLYIKHPEYLATPSDNAAQRAVNLVSAISTSFQGGPLQFVTNILPGLVETEEQLSRAVGYDAAKAKDIKNLQVRSLDQILDRASIVQLTAKQHEDAASASAKTIAEYANEVLALKEQVQSDRKQVLEVKNLAEKLARGNASQNPLEKLVREARDRSDEISEKLNLAVAQSDKARSAAESANDSQSAAKEVLVSLESINGKADDILRNATQAGLAGAYKIERDRLSKEQNRFALAFYGGVVAIVVYAAFFIIPVITRIIENGADPQTKIGESALVLFARLAILAPVLWALVFTNRRHSNLETLQMDYAAKAATALAYSGYKEEMDDDKLLARKLRDGLVVRFIEHPERLLHKNSVKERVEIDGEKFRYSSSAARPDERRGVDEDAAAE